MCGLGIKDVTWRVEGDELIDETRGCILYNHDIRARLS